MSDGNKFSIEPLRRWARWLVFAALVALCGPVGAAITFDPTPSSGGAGLNQMEIIQDAGNAALSGAYLGVRFSSNTVLSNVYARAVVSGAGYSLDATQEQDIFIGDLSATAKTAYWFINYPTIGNGTMRVQIYVGNPAAGGVLQSTSTSYTVSSANADNSAAANKIVSVAVVPTSLQLGQNFNIVVCYGVNSTDRLLVGPVVNSAFDPSNLRLGNTVVETYASSDCSGAITTTLSNQLLFAGPISSSSVRATYTFKTVGSLSVALTPIVSARTGIYKYNADFNTPPAGVSYTVPAPTNNVTLAKSVNIATNSVGNISVTYTITATNTGSAAVVLDKIIDTLPSSPGAVTYTANSTTVNGVSQAGFNPVISSQTLTWGSTGTVGTTFTVPAGGTFTLGFNAIIPAANGVYTNSAIAKINTTQIDSTASTGDNAPATVSTRIGPPVLAVTKTADTPLIVNTATGTTARYTLKVINSGTAATSVTLNDTALPAGFTYFSTVAINTPTSGSCLSAATRTSLVDPVVGATSPSWGNFSVPGGCEVSVQFNASVANSVADGTYNNSATTTTATAGATITNFDGTPAATTSDNVTVTSAALTVTKTTSTPIVAPLGAATYTITVTNSGTAAASGVRVTDNLPAGFSYASTTSLTVNGVATTAYTVGGTAAAPQWDSAPVGGFAVNAGQTLVIVFNATVSGMTGAYDNSASATSVNARNITNFDGTTSAAETVTVVASKLTVTKVFSPGSIGTSDSALLTISLVNPNDIAVTGTAFTDNYPSGLVNTAAPGAVITGAGCSGTVTVTAAAIGSSLALSAGNVPARSSCDITVNVTSSTANTYINSSGAVSTTNAGTSSAVNGTLLVLNHITALKTFTPTSVVAGSPSLLKITLTNPNTVALTGVAFNDAYPAGLVNTSTPTGAISGVGCSGTVTAAANGSSLALSAGNVPASSSCDITVNVTSSAAGSYVNNSGVVSTANAGAGASSGATLTVTQALQAPGVSKTFTPAVILTGSNSLLRVTIMNPNAVAITGAAFTDNYPATLSNTGNGVFSASSITAGCTGTITGAIGGTSLALANGNIPVGVSCMIEVNVTSNSAVPVLLTNPSFNVSTSNTPTGNAVAANLQVLVRPTIAKSFTPSTVLVGAPSTLNLVITNPNPIALSALAFTDTFPAGLAVATAPNAVNGCGGALNASAGATSVALTGGALAANQSCTLSAQVSATIGAYSNTSGGVSSFETGAAGVPSNTAVLTVNAVSGVQIEGFVYNDQNHNLQRDGTEAGTGLTLYAKLVAAGAPAGPASQAVAVDPAMGAYLFIAVAPGEYVIVIDDNATLSDITPTIPSGWTGTEASDQIRRNVVVAAVDLRVLNFGLFNGNRATGRVFRDNGSGGGTPNNVVQDGTEAGIGQAAVRLTNAAGTTTYDSTTTDAAGNYGLWIAASLNGASLRVIEDNAANHRSVGGSPVGSYDRGADSLAFVFTAGINITNLNFADVAIETLVSGQQRTAAPGESVFYAHVFTPGTGGSVVFSATSSAGWAQTLMRDTNCNGVVDASEGVVSAAIATTESMPVCVILKVLVPSGAAVGAQNRSTLQAVLSYSNASPPLSVSLMNEDQTTVGSAGLALVKNQDNATPLPGGRITYTIGYSNQGGASINSIRINDTTPAFTRFVSAVCVAPLAAGLSACSVTASPAAGASGSVEFTLTGSLLPSAFGQVRFSVDLVSGP